MTPKQAWKARNKEKMKIKSAEYYQRKKNDPGFIEKRAAAMERFKASPAYVAGYQKKNKSRVGCPKAKVGNRKRNLRKYGLTPEQYDQMVQAQNNKCAICGGGPRPVGFLLGVDHCHGTGKVRGLLCLPCNHAMGIFKDSILLLKNAALYLEKYSAG